MRLVMEQNIYSTWELIWCVSSAQARCTRTIRSRVQVEIKRSSTRSKCSILRYQVPNSNKCQVARSHITLQAPNTFSRIWATKISNSTHNILLKTSCKTYSSSILNNSTVTAIRVTTYLCRWREWGLMEVHHSLNLNKINQRKELT